MYKNYIKLSCSSFETERIEAFGKSPDAGTTGSVFWLFFLAYVVPFTKEEPNSTGLLQCLLGQ